MDLAAVLCPPFDTISPEHQRELHQRSAYNAVHIELAEDSNGGRYERAAAALGRWQRESILKRDASPAFYLYRQEFKHEGQGYSRSLLLARLKLEPWEKGGVLPHEETFGGPKEDRLKLLRATRLNSSPVFLIYRDQFEKIGRLLDHALDEAPLAEFTTLDTQCHTLRRIEVQSRISALSRAFEGETLYVADGHHRYETALAYRDERRREAKEWTGEEPENFVLAALTSMDDPGLLVLPVHRLTSAGAPLPDSLDRLRSVFHIERTSSPEHIPALLSERGRTGPVFGLLAHEAHAYLLALADQQRAHRLLPQERSPAWRQLDYAIANYAILRYGLGLGQRQMSDYGTLWFTEDAREAIASLRSGRARYAVLLNPVPVSRIIDIADSGERMPQKSTFFYPKVQTGLAFNLLED